MRQIITILFLLSCTNIYGQKYNIQGSVYSNGNDTANLNNATVQVMGTNLVTRTQNDGRFSFITDLVEGKLKVTFLGFKTKEVPFNSNSESPIIVYLEPDNNNLEEVQVIGYGQTTKRFNTGSVATISAKEIEQQPVTNVLSALSGRMTGVYVQTTNGLPGGNINIQIRGTGSIQAGTIPLYIIDGVPYNGEGVNNGNILSTENIAGAINPLNIFNPNDIENISVLKDADATAIYGSRGSNGVILITTKRGKSGGTRINLNINQGFNKVTTYPHLLSLEQYLDLRREAFANDNRIPSSDPESDAYAPDLTIWSQTVSINWPKYIYGNIANLTSSQLSISGGNRNTNFNLSGNFRSEGTILLGDNKYKKGGLQSTIGHISDNNRFKVNLSSIYNVDNTDFSNPIGASSEMFLLPPNYPLRNEDGSYNWYSGHNIDAQQLSRSLSSTNNLIGNLVMSYYLPIGVGLKLSGGYTYRNSNQQQLFPTQSLYPGETNYTTFGSNTFTSLILEPQAEYKKRFHRSELQILIGGTYQSSSTDRISITATNFSNESLMENLGSAETISARANNTQQYKYVSGFGRMTYKIMDRYIFNTTVRRDGSSRFGSSNQFGNFFSIGGAWIFSEENWFGQNNGFITFGKLRVSYGLTGNDQIPDYQYFSTYQANGSNIYQGIGVLKPSRVFNTQFHWEATRKMELATELGFKENRIFLTVNYYRNKSDNQLVSYPLPKITGFPNYQANLPAIVQNTGWEFDLSARIIENQNFRWTTTANITLPKNKLVKFDNIENSSYAKTHKVGYDITRIYGYQFTDVDAQTGYAQYIGENGEISDNPYQFHTLGKRTPDYYGGVGNNFTYKNFQLDIFAQFSKQSSFGNLLFNQFGSLPQNGFNMLSSRWSSVGDIASLPKVSSVYRNDLYYFGESSGNFFNTAYLRLKNISLSYKLPAHLSKKIKSESIQLSVAAQNILTFWDKEIPLLDPEIGRNGQLTATIPPAKSVVFGLNITF
ncbi:SusC/RagA family TonB-linked outer membrane protein [Sphingobacterium mizutaii]|uniref:SusC/RagA family TonB-linked outer membrane protein n=1 Tax=Sphingobacterium mizutaii TaxID=1010 RepID=UPI0016244F24|nr:SusC/RagA family TonB-linked outer membrane protein [Sphingobacterium mizutaii]